MNSLAIIEKYYEPQSLLYAILVKHSNAVTQKALEIAENHPEMPLDKTFIQEAAMVHDIGKIWKDDYSSPAIKTT